MARTYAGILGPLAFCLVVARGLTSGASSEATLKVAAAAMFGFAAIGYLLGRLAATTIAQSVNAKLTAELAALKDADPTGAAPPS